MKRGIVGIVADASQALLDKINAAQAAGTNAQNAAQQAQATANAAQTASQAADTTATNLANAVASGNAVHTTLSDRITALEARATALEAKVTAIGTGRITAALIVGATVDITVTLSRTMPNTTYTVQVAPTNGFTFGTPKNKTTTSVVIPVTAALALAVGATFQVIAIT